MKYSTLLAVCQGIFENFCVRETICVKKVKGILLLLLLNGFWGKSCARKEKLVENCRKLDRLIFARGKTEEKIGKSKRRKWKAENLVRPHVAEPHFMSENAHLLRAPLTLVQDACSGTVPRRACGTKSVRCQ